MLNKKTLFILLALLVGYLVINSIFKVGYSTRNVIVIDSLKISDSVVIRNSFAVIGSNYKGNIEAIIFPQKEQRFKDFGIIEYYYLRFGPKWYEKNVMPRVLKQLEPRQRLVGSLIQKAEIAHEDNFLYCCHYGNYPIVHEGLTTIRVSVLGAADKLEIRF